MARKLSTRRFLNLNTFTDFSLRGYNNCDYVYYQVQPYNLTVMDDENIKEKIFQLCNAIKQIESFFILVINGKENFEANKEYINERIDDEEDDFVKELLHKTYDDYDDMQVNSATNRSFIIGIIIQKNTTLSVFPFLSQAERILVEEGFSVRKLNMEDLKSILALYYENNTIIENFEDVDGERWYRDSE